ncbi:MAG: hypothetical protein N2235_01245 [Fischerella sp.]|nr:hypothetical protein [Fischerella sp.]
MSDYYLSRPNLVSCSSGRASVLTGDRLSKSTSVILAKWQRQLLCSETFQQMAAQAQTSFHEHE